MTCFIVLIIAGLIALPRLREIGFFGATTTVPPDIEITRKHGALGVYINPDLVPSLTADVDPGYGGRTSTNVRIEGPSIGQDMFDYLTSKAGGDATINARNLDSGQSITPRTNR
jgi:hypothetical protein